MNTSSFDSLDHADYKTDNCLIYQGDCLEVLKTLPDNFVDSIVVDPPYGLEFMGKEWDTFRAKNSIKQVSGMMKEKKFKQLPSFSKSRNIKCPKCGKWEWDYPERKCICGGADEYAKQLFGKAFYDFCFQWAKEVLRILKPGGHLLSFGGSRTYHRMACAIEDAGFEIRDMIEWMYGSGFPKSLNIGKAVDKLQGNERDKTHTIIRTTHKKGTSYEWAGGNDTGICDYSMGTSAWEGWGTALKPAHEPICMARKPLSEKTVAENVLKWGVGGINVDGCRIPSGIEHFRGTVNCSITNDSGEFKSTSGFSGKDKIIQATDSPLGRFPANLVHDGSDEVMRLFPSGKVGARKKGQVRHIKNGDIAFVTGITKIDYPASEGSAARFFYCAKASRSERNRGCEGLENQKYVAGNYSQSPVCKTCNKTLNGSNDHSRCSGEIYYKEMPSRNTGNNHPTVKPIKLMEYLIKLITPPNGIVLDMFMGSGSTGIACKNLNRKFIGIELNKDYTDMSIKRIKSVLI